MEIQLYGLRWPRRSPTTITTDKIRNSDTTHHEWTTYGWSSNNTGRNKVDQLGNRAAVHDQHHQRTSGKSRQAGINTNGLETWRQVVSRFSIPVGIRSIGFLTKLLKPHLDESKFEESFATREFDTSSSERNNRQRQIAFLMNETRSMTTACTTASIKPDLVQPDQTDCNRIPSCSSILQKNAATPASKECTSINNLSHRWTSVQNTKTSTTKENMEKEKDTIMERLHLQLCLQSRQRKNNHNNPIGRGNPFQRTRKR